MEDRKNEGNKPLTSATDNTAEETTPRQRPKRQKLEPLSKEKIIKQEKKPTPKSNKSPKTPTKTPPKDQGDDFFVAYHQSPKKKDYLANLQQQMKEKDKKIEILEKANAALQKDLNAMNTEAAESRGELKVMRVLLAQQKEDIEYMRNIKK